MARVLVVDDSPMDRRLAQGILEKNTDMAVQACANGVEALELIERGAPDVVVTDLQMPEMDGLELVSAVRNRYPLVPVVLMTAHGSEEIAVQALERGASSYVAKSLLARDLSSTVYTVLALARADRFHERLMDCLTSTSAAFVLDNDPALIFPLVDHLQQQVSHMRLCDETGRIRIGLALEEALLNALYHGNLGISAREMQQARDESNNGHDLIHQRLQQPPFCDRRIHVTAEISTQQARFVIRDEGAGFDSVALTAPFQGNNHQQETGRGLVLMRSFMDEVRFNARGNEVTMIKRHDASAAAG